MNIFIQKDGQQHGPCSLDEVNSKALTGEFSSSDPAWIEGWADWQPLSCLSGFVSRPVPPPFRQPVSPPPIAPSTSTEPQVRLGPIIRDIVIVWVLTAIGGFVAGVATGGPRDAQRFMLALMVSGLLLGTVAFTIAGCLAPPARWRHLGFVALGAWFTGLINVVFFGVSIPQWIEGAIFMGIIMGIGGAISYLFKRDTKPFKPQVALPSAQLRQVQQTSKIDSARTAWYGSATTVGTYVAGLLLLVVGFLSQESADTYDVPHGIHAQAAAIIGGACPALLAGAGLYGWYRWFRGRRGSVIMLIGILAAVKGLGTLIARLLIISYLTQTSPGVTPVIAIQPPSMLSQSSSITATEKDQEFQRQRAKSKAEAITLYPDVADHKTRLGKEVDRLIESYKATDDPILYAPDAPMLITRVAARNLGVAPSSGK